MFPVPFIRVFFLLTVLLVGANLFVYGQSTVPPLFDVYTSNEIWKKLELNKIGKAQAAQELAVIGKYKDAQLLLGYENLLELKNQNINELSFSDLLNAADSRIVIINESHHMPNHRRFLFNQLKILYEAGYRYLALETLTNAFDDSLALRLDMELLERGFPLFSQYTGIYSREPEYGNLIRKAIELGFEIIAYERTTRGGDREFIQAQNIYNKTFGIDETSMVVVFCGYHHVFDNSNGKRKMMAEYLRELSGHAPLTFYQLNAFNKSLESKFCQPSPLILSNDELLVFYDSIDITNRVDYFVYHFNPIFYYGIPDWKFDGQKFEIFDITEFFGDDAKNLVFPIIGKIFFANERTIATPVEIFEWSNTSMPAFVVLNQGVRYRVQLRDKKDKEIEIFLDW